MATILNVLGKLRDNDKYLTIDPQTFGSVKPAKQDADKRWRDDLDQLDRAFKGQPTIDQAERTLAEVTSFHDAQVKAVEERIAQASKALKVVGLTAFDRSVLDRNVERLRDELRAAKDLQRMRVAQAKGKVDDRRVWEPQRKRWVELSKRAKELDAALNQVR